MLTLGAIHFVTGSAWLLAFEVCLCACVCLARGREACEKIMMFQRGVTLKIKD